MKSEKSCICKNIKIVQSQTCVLLYAPIELTNMTEPPLYAKHNSQSYMVAHNFPQ